MLKTAPRIFLAAGLALAGALSGPLEQARAQQPTTPIRTQQPTAPATAQEPTPATAQDPMAPATAQPAAASVPISVNTTVAPGTVAPELDVRDGAIQLSLDQALEIALQRNVGLVVQRYNRMQSRFGVLQNLGIYDLRPDSRLQLQDTNEPGATRFQASQFEQQRLDTGVSQLLPTGGDLRFGWVASRQEFGATFGGSNFNPQFDSGLSLNLAQPLLRGFGRLPTERLLRIAQVNSRISRQDFETQVADTLRQVENAYWDLVEARAQLNVAEQSLGLAKELHERNRIQVEVGTLAPLELVQSEAAISTREEEIIRAQAAVGDAEDRLRQFLNLPPGASWTARVVPTTAPEIPRVEVDLEQALETALAERPELRGQSLVIDRAKIDAAFFRSETKPSLDLTVNYSSAGTGGNLIVTDPTTGVQQVVPGGFGDAFSQLTNFGFNSWTATLVFGYPLQNRAARALRANADVLVESAAAQLSQLETSIATEVRTAVRGVDTAAKQIEAARASVRFQERNLDAERKRYENGMSTSYRINQVQDDLTQARSREVSAVTNYRRALAAYYLATGRLLEEKRVDVADQEAVVRRFGFGQ